MHIPAGKNSTGEFYGYYKDSLCDGDVFLNSLLAFANPALAIEALAVVDKAKEAKVLIH